MSKSRTITFVTLGYTADGRKLLLTSGEMDGLNRKAVHDASRELPALGEAIAASGETFKRVLTFTRHKVAGENPDLAKVVSEAPEKPAAVEPELVEEPAAVAQESVSARHSRRAKRRA